MLAIRRALMSEPLLIVDVLPLGLAGHREGALPDARRDPWPARDLVLDGPSAALLANEDVRNAYLAP